MAKKSMAKSDLTYTVSNALHHYSLRSFTSFKMTAGGQT